MTEDISSGILKIVLHVLPVRAYILDISIGHDNLKTAVLSCMLVFKISEVVLCCIATGAMCTSTRKYKTNKLAATCVNERTTRRVRCLLYLKMRNVYQITLLSSSNDND